MVNESCCIWVHFYVAEKSFNMILANVSSLARIDIGVKGLMFLWYLSNSSHIKFVIRVRKEFGFDLRNS